MAQASIDVAEKKRSCRIEQDGNRDELAFDEIRDEKLQTEKQVWTQQTKLNSFCDKCFLLNFTKISALYLCYLCNQYMCVACNERHDKSHRMVELESKGDERDEQIERFLDAMRNESKIEREVMFNREDVSVVDRVDVKHELDTSDDYWISGLCGLDDTRWVICDYYNDCIKIFSIGSHILQRYIRFGSEPFGVTEVKVNPEPTEQGVMAASVSSSIKVKKVKQEFTEQGVIPTTDISVPNQLKTDKQCMLAVTLPGKRIILFIGLTQNPAVITKSIKTKKHCLEIAFSGDQIVTVCNDKYPDGYGYDGPWFISLLSKAGDELKTINTPLGPSWSDPRLAVSPGRFYLTDWDNHKVLCMNDKGEVVSHKTLGMFYPRAISVDPDTDNVYIIDWGNSTLCRLDSRLESFESLFKFNSVDTGSPRHLCVYRDRLYVSHGPWESTHGHIVTVVRVL